MQICMKIIIFNVTKESHGAAAGHASAAIILAWKPGIDC